MDEGDFYRAIGEFKRFLFLSPEGSEADAARFAIGRAYLRGGQPTAAITHFARLARIDGFTAKNEALLELAYARYLAGDFVAASAELSQWLVLIGPQAPEASRQRAGYLLGWTLLDRGKTEDAAKQFESLHPFSAQKALADASRSLSDLPYRSPALAGALSIVPGLGHLYIGQPLIGLAAFAWNALFGFALYDSIHRGSVGLALVVGFFEALWYSGTIFGAVSGAQKFNRDVRLNALEALRHTYDDRPESWPPSPPLQAPYFH